MPVDSDRLRGCDEDRDWIGLGVVVREIASDTAMPKGKDCHRWKSPCVPVKKNLFCIADSASRSENPIAKIPNSIGTSNQLNFMYIVLRKTRRIV